MRQRFEGASNRIAQTVARIMVSLRRFYLVAVVLDAMDAFNRNQMSLLAASLSYYALLALFPLLLVLVGGASFFIAEDVALEAVMRFAGQYLPGVENQVRAILHQVVDLRGTATVIGLLTLLWSASGVFDVLQQALNRAWRASVPRAFWLQRLFSIAVIAILGAFFLVSILVSSATMDFLSGLFGDAFDARAWQRDAANWLGFALSVVVIFLLYKFFPHARVTWRAALGGALAAAVLWQIAKFGYVVYLGYFSRLNFVYGSLGAVIGLMLWGYLSAAIILWGAELAARFGRAE
jgi:membrane protein